MANVAINGLGRIGRATLKIVLDTPELTLVAANDLIDTDNLAYLLAYDTVYGRYHHNVDHDEDHLIIDGNAIPVFSEKDPAQLPWDELDVDVVFECTGVFTDREGLQKHLDAGARFAILSAPAKGEGVPTIVHGVNDEDARNVQMISTASCTTNSITPVVEILGRRLGIEKAIMTTIHAYTSSQNIVDGPSKKTRRGRAAAANLVPTSTGAAIATTKVLTEYEGRFDGVAVRVPVAVGSISDIVFVTSRPTDVEEINQIFREEAQSERYQGILGVTDDPIVSSDIIQDPRPAIVDLGMTQVVGGNLVKVMAWYDNEWGYSSQMVRQAVALVGEKQAVAA